MPGISSVCKHVGGLVGVEKSIANIIFSYVGKNIVRVH